MRRDVTVLPKGWTNRGEAYIQKGQRRLIIWSGIPDERALVHIYHFGQNQDFARFLAPADAPHPDRQEPSCARYNSCGGCPMMHLTEDGQRRAKLRSLHGLLGEVGLADVTPDTVVSAPDNDWDYRHVVKLVVGRSDQGHLRVGTRGRDGRSIITIPNCPVSTPTLRKLMISSAHHLRQLELDPYEPRRHRGVMRYIVLRQSRQTGKVLVTLVAGQKDRRLWHLAERVAADNPTVVGVHLHYNDLEGNAIFARDEDGNVPTMPIRGQETIEERLGGLRLNVGAGDFFQVNPAVAERIMADVVAAFDGDRDRPVVDLYSGVGGFTLGLCRAHGWALGVEGVTGAVQRAKDNARLNNLGAEFIAGEVATVLPEIAARLDGRAPVVMVDPARRGLEEGVIDALAALQPARLAYLSCNPRTLARDLKRFTDDGWRVDQVTAYDMFPQTAHLEVLAMLSPQTPPPPATRRAPRRRIVR
ncbi:MAG: 23S rRNA (uracil(1939)-C(5))-methyltransferase RlmD [Myxococcota bacterium]